MLMHILSVVAIVLTVNAQALSNSPSMKAANASTVKQLLRVKEIPFNPDDESKDAAFIRLRANKWKIANELVNCISNTKKRQDPRSEPTKVSTFTVGDLAFFLIVDFYGVSFDEIMLRHVTKDELSKRGVCAYFEWVNAPGNRLILRDECRELLRHKIDEHK